MNKNVIIGLVVIVIAVGAWFVFDRQAAVDTADKAAGTASDAAEQAGDAAQDAATAAGTAAERATDAAGEAATAAGQAAGAAVDAAGQAASDAADAASKAASDAASAANEAAKNAATAAGEAVDAAGQAASDAVDSVTGTTPPVAEDPALTVAGFDPVKVKAQIDGSSLDEATKTSLKAVVDQAAANPALVETTLTSVRAALGVTPQP